MNSENELRNNRLAPQKILMVQKSNANPTLLTRHVMNRKNFNWILFRARLSIFGLGSFLHAIKHDFLGSDSLRLARYDRLADLDERQTSKPVMASVMNEFLLETILVLLKLPLMISFVQNAKTVRFFSIFVHFRGCVENNHLKILIPLSNVEF